MDPFVSESKLLSSVSRKRSEYENIEEGEQETNQDRYNRKGLR